MINSDLEGTLEGLLSARVPQNQPQRVHFWIHFGVHDPMGVSSYVPRGPWNVFCRLE